MIYEDKMEKSLANLGEEYATIGAGRTVHILDKIKIDYYGTPTPLQQVSETFSVLEAKNGFVFSLGRCT